MMEKWEQKEGVARPGGQAARGQATCGQAARGQATREQAARGQATREQAARGQATREQAVRGQRRRKRWWLLGFAVLITVIVIGFLSIVNLSQPRSVRGTLNLTLLITGGAAVAALTVFIFKGDIFDDAGRMLKNSILFMMIAVICIVQLTLFFATFSFRLTEFNAESLAKSTEIFESIREDGWNVDESAGAGDGGAGVYPGGSINGIPLPQELSRIYKTADASVVNPTDAYRFPIGDETVVMELSDQYMHQVILKILVDLLTMLAASIILTVELVIFALKFIDDRFETGNAVAESGTAALVNVPMGTGTEALVNVPVGTGTEALVNVPVGTGTEALVNVPVGTKTEAPENIAAVAAPAKEYRMVSYVRQISFLFYFASRMGTPFIALLAKRLGGSAFGIPENVLAGIPQSAEFLFTCVAIFLTSVIIEKQGWKLPFAGGLVIVAAGTVFSALSPNLALFILSRALVGVGYGFCWMTLRNFALFASTAEEKALCFALLNAGIYAGMNCGAVMGSVLADIIGYVPVLLISSGLTVLCALPILRLENVRYVKPEEAAKAVKGTEEAAAKAAKETAEAAAKAAKRTAETAVKAAKRTAEAAVKAAKRTAEAAATPASEGGRITAGDILQLTRFIILLIIPSCILGSYLGYYLPIYLTDQGGSVADIGRAQLIYGLIIVYLGPAMVRVMQKHYQIRRWSVCYNLLFAGGLILFGLWGGFVPAMLAMAVIGLADAFGFVAQNNYFLEFPVSQKMGHSRALSCISIIKKLAEMLGPIAFGFLFVIPGTVGVALLGGVFLTAAALYLILDKGRKQF